METVTKGECINHIQNRIGTSFRKLKDELKEEKITKSGKIIKRSLVGGIHQLTDKQINAYQRHFGKAIRECVCTNILNTPFQGMGMEITTTSIATRHGASLKKPEKKISQWHLITL